MPRFITSTILSESSTRLINSKAKSGFADFLVLKRAIQRSGSEEVPFSSVDSSFTGAMRDMTSTFPLLDIAATPVSFKPFVKIWGTAGAEKYLTRKYLTNGAADTLSGTNWSSVVQITGRKPRRGSLKGNHFDSLPTIILKANGHLPSLLDSALWYYRATDLESKFGEIPDMASLCQQLRDGFVNELGLTEEELAVLFDRDANALEELNPEDILQDAVAAPQDYLPDLNTGSGNVSELVSSFTGLTAQETAGLRVQKELFLRFASALGSKRFLILSGLAGSGKTKLAQAFARWLTPVSDDGEQEACVVVPVGADWTGSDAVLGYPDGLDSTRYVTRPALELIQRAMAAEGDGTPHFLILDEMNLSHVERYFADLLSLIESGDTTRLYQPEKDEDGNVCFRSDVDPVLRLPSNLFIIGTVNVDETTYMFSPKVLDRANVIEFRADRDDMKDFLKKPRTPDLDAFNEQGKGFGPAYVLESGKQLTVPVGIADVFEKEMLLFFDLLAEHNAEFGFRVGNEAARFMHFYRVLAGKEESSADWFDEAMDAVIVQKLLPKLHGSRTKLEGLLWSLAYACGAARGADAKAFLAECRKAGKAEDEKTHSPESVYAVLKQKNPEEPLKDARYKLSFDKILRMYRKLIRDQFVTFAEA
jgi:MoxR-like ATPase